MLHASFNHAYPPHTHDAWTVLLVDDGVVRYDLDRSARGAEVPMVTVLPPHVVHDGRPGGSTGYRKRVLYVETSVLPEHLIGAAVFGVLSSTIKQLLPGDPGYLILCETHHL